MKRAIIILYVSAMLCLLSGCHQGIFSGHQDMERLRPIQTIGFDRQEEGIVMSISSGIGPEDAPPLVMKCAASSIETAITRLQDYSPEDELFYAHVQYILLGQTLAEHSVMPLLNWATRSPTMRTGTSLFIVKGNADTTVTATGGAETDVTERLATLERESLVRGQHIYTLREVAAALADRGCALCLAVQAYPSTNIIFTDTKASAAIVPVGYAVLQDGAVSAYLNQNETLGAQLLDTGAVGAELTLSGNVLELFEGSAQASGQWDEGGELTGIYVHGTVKAGILEREEGGESDIGILQEQLHAAAIDAITAVITCSQTLGCDFLNLEASVTKNAPGHRLSEVAEWETLFSSLPVTVEIDSEISRSYDLSN